MLRNRQFAPLIVFIKAGSPDSVRKLHQNVVMQNTTKNKLTVLAYVYVCVYVYIVYSVCVFVMCIWACICYIYILHISDTNQHTYLSSSYPRYILLSKFKCLIL